jgi:hypothetical protein
MIFLIDYDQHTGLKQLRTFEDSQHEAAANVRFELELRYHREGIHREVVLLQAADEQAIRRTHGRYFHDPAEFERRLKKATESA